ncbi:MAG: hypothetical protein OSJ70_02925 [Bacilli bacterium]|nr:hypothetical protein [Bacilli bacterium]
MSELIGFWNDNESRMIKSAIKHSRYNLDNANSRASSSLIDLNKAINNISYDMEKILENLRNLRSKYDGDEKYLLNSIIRDINNFLDTETKDMKRASIMLNESLNEGIKNIDESIERLNSLI